VYLLHLCPICLLALVRYQLRVVYHFTKEIRDVFLHFWRRFGEVFEQKIDGVYAIAYRSHQDAHFSYISGLKQCQQRVKPAYYSHSFEHTNMLYRGGII
jgi:hypothetical protein